MNDIPEMLDGASLKANAMQAFNARNMGREKANQIVFRTV